MSIVQKPYLLDFGKVHFDGAERQTFDDRELARERAVPARDTLLLIGPELHSFCTFSNPNMVSTTSIRAQATSIAAHPTKTIPIGIRNRNSTTRSTRTNQKTNSRLAQSGAPRRHGPFPIGWPTSGCHCWLLETRHSELVQQHSYYCCLAINTRWKPSVHKPNYSAPIRWVGCPRQPIKA